MRAPLALGMIVASTTGPIIIGAANRFKPGSAQPNRPSLLARAAVATHFVAQRCEVSDFFDVSLDASATQMGERRVDHRFVDKIG